MKSATSNEIKTELKQLPHAELLEICLRLVRFKKENKELLTFHLFESNDIEGFIKTSKEDISNSFAAVNSSNLYWAKKSLRKILRDTNKLIRYAGNRQVEVELLLHYCILLQQSGIPFHKSPAIFKLFLGQVKKVKAAIETMHEDLQYDYMRTLDMLVTESSAKK